MSSETLFHSETYSVLNSLTDNVFLADGEMKLVWMNEAAEKIIQEFFGFFDINDASELIGKKLSDLHSFDSSYHHVMKKKNIFPHQATIKIFDEYVANIVVNQVTDDENSVKGYILFWQDITKQEELRNFDQKLINELSTPVLPSMLSNTLFVPLIGSFNEKRIDHLTSKLLQEVLRSDADYIVFDMSGVTIMENETVAQQLDKVVESVYLMGPDVFFAGFTKELVKEFVKLDNKYKQNTFPHYRQAMNHIMKMEGYEIVKKPIKR
ncbi:STAS domain-containing protein [Salipaludibacillus daqingensis]|uniref:STAS domain-containing protein n=1 Tax=Salipaludibacillus daqingensis TaxID=3041001 RepID=UPI003CC898F1